MSPYVNKKPPQELAVGELVNHLIIDSVAFGGWNPPVVWLNSPPTFCQGFAMRYVVHTSKSQRIRWAYHSPEPNTMMVHKLVYHMLHLKRNKKTDSFVGLVVCSMSCSPQGQSI